MIQYKLFNGNELIENPNAQSFGHWSSVHSKVQEILENKNDFDCVIIFLDKIHTQLFLNDISDRIFKETEKYSPCPIIFIGLEDLFSETDDSFTKTNLYRKLNIPLYYRFLDDSIWNHYLYLLDPEFEQHLKRSIERIKDFNKLRLYEMSVTKEYIEYNTRILKENNLVDLKGHGTYVLPYLFHSESLSLKQTKIAKDLEFFYPKYNCNETPLIKGIALRILLIDDKLGKTDLCKATLIKKLFSCDWIGVYEERCSLRKNICWRTPETKNEISKETNEVELLMLDRKQTLEQNNINIIITESDSSVTNEVKLLQYDRKQAHEQKTIYKIIPEGNSSSFEAIEFDIFELTERINKLDSKKNQIIAVKTLDVARELLSHDKLRFDLIMMDYLLDEINDENFNRREYATEFWGDGKEKYFEISESELKEKVKSEQYTETIKDNYLTIKSTYDKIKANRGPLQRLWIFPITAFNQTFIDDLRNKGVRLIDYYWYLSRGADPINTPYLFINTLNNFLQLQILQAVFSLKTVVAFLKKSCEDIEGIMDAEAFQAHMGSEYTVLIQKHGWRPVISRDAKAGSLFSKYIWENFYSKTENKFLFRLMDKMQKFFHICTYADKTDYDKMMLYWKELDIFITDYWPDLMNEYTAKMEDADNIVKPEISIFCNKINNFLDKNKN